MNSPTISGYIGILLFAMSPLSVWKARRTVTEMMHKFIFYTNTIVFNRFYFEN